MKIICGMHRSGTSLVSSLLFKCGLDFGNPKDFYPADKLNPLGYYENKKISLANKKLIEGKWGRLSYFYLPNKEIIKRRFVRNINYFDGLQEEFNNKWVKDPRFCFTINLWPKNIQSLIIVLRHPVAIAKSLKKRNYITISYGLKLWRSHILNLLMRTKKINKVFISYENLLSENHQNRELSKLLEEVNKHESKIDINLLKQNLNKKFSFSKNDENDLILLKNFKCYQTWKFIQKNLL